MHRREEVFSESVLSDGDGTGDIQAAEGPFDLHAFQHIFGRICDDNEIEHRLTKINHLWTNGQA